MKKTLEEREAQIEKRLGKKNTTKRSSEFIQNYTQYIIQLFCCRASNCRKYSFGEGSEKIYKTEKTTTKTILT